MITNNIIQIVEADAILSNEIFGKNTTITFYNDSSKIKIADGITKFNDLPYVGAASSGESVSNDSTYLAVDNLKAPLIGGRTKVRNSIGTRVLATFMSKSLIYNNPASLTDVVTNDSMIGTTAVQATITTTQTQYSPLNILSIPVNVNNGIIKFWFKPISNLAGRLDRFSIELHSAGTPAAPTTNFHQLDIGNSPSNFTSMLTSTTGEGRWQSYGIAVSNFILAGTGADLTNITFARLNIRGTAGSIISMQIHSIEFVPNILTKAKAIFTFDDSYINTYAFTQLAKYGFRAIIYPSPITTTIGVDSTRLSPQQVRNLHDNLGWQIGSQAWSTENINDINAMDDSMLTQELSKIRTWQKSLGITGGEDGSYFSGVTHQNMTAYPAFRKHFRTMRRFDAGNNANPPLFYGETFPFGDPMNVRCLNGATVSWGTNTSTRLQAHVDQAITNKGVALFAWHNDLASTGNARTGFDALLVYLDSQRANIDVCTIEDLYNGY